jgi:hypothetical protein
MSNFGWVKSRIRKFIHHSLNQAQNQHVSIMVGPHVALFVLFFLVST